LPGDWHVKERKVWKTKSSSKERTESRDKNKKKQGEDNTVWFCEECEL